MQRGFSLLELSIVLVIIGLITGGIMAGRSMVAAAELRSMISDLRKYQTAINTFRDKYGGYPGDLNNAVQYWGAQAGSTANGLDATCASLTTAATSTATCNGNGDGQITASVANLVYEDYRAWQHLANAGLVEGQFSGVAGPAGYVDSTPGVNIPASKRQPGGYMFYYLNVTTAGGIYFPAIGNNIYLGADNTTTNALPMYPLLTVAEQYNLEQKMDDGLPGTGITKSLTNASGFTPNCATTADPTTAVYNLTYTGLACSIVYSLGF